MMGPFPREPDIDRQRHVRRDGRQPCLGEWTALMQTQASQATQISPVSQASPVSLVAARVTPRVVMIGLGVHLGLYGLLSLLSVALSEERPIPNLVIASYVLRLVLTAIAYFLALLLNVEVAAEYRQARWLRFAWLALAANAGISIFRPFVESSVINRLWDQPSDGPISGLLQHLVIIPANLFLLLGVLAMCWAYHQVGLGSESKRAIIWRWEDRHIDDRDARPGST